MPINAGPKANTSLHAGLGVKRPALSGVRPSSPPLQAGVIPVADCPPCGWLGATYAYTAEGMLSRVTFSDGSHHDYIWSDGRLQFADFTVTGRPKMRKSFHYNASGLLETVVQSEV